MPFVTANGAKLHYLERGQGPAVVFSHGLFWSEKMFAPQVEALSDSYRCIAYDHRGQGESEVAAGGYEMDSIADDGAALIEALGAGPCHWVGLSMGGWTGMRLAARKPQLIRSLSLLNTAGDAEPFGNLFAYKLMGLIARWTGQRPFAGTAMKTLCGKSFMTDPLRANERAELRARLIGNSLPGARRSLYAVLDRKPMDPEVAKITAPTLVIAGEEDTAISPARSQRTAALIPNAEFCLIPRAGHTSTLEEPAAVTRALRAFLDKQPRFFGAA